MHPTHQPAAPDEVTPADTLRGAARYITAHGWTQDNYYDHTTSAHWPPADVIGAIGMAVHGEAVDNPHATILAGRDAFGIAYLALWNHINRANGIEYADLAIWNDLPNLTADTVIAALNAAADTWDHTHGGAS